MCQNEWHICVNSFCFQSFLLQYSAQRYKIISIVKEIGKHLFFMSSLIYLHCFLHIFVLHKNYR